METIYVQSRHYEGSFIQLLIIFDFDLNYTYAKINYTASEVNFQSRFNTPEHKVKASFGGRELYKRFGFKINWRWNDGYLWESDFATAILPARSRVDIQINLVIPKWKSIIKLGGVNISQNEYVSAPRSSLIGSQYYLSWIIND